MLQILYISLLIALISNLFSKEIHKYKKWLYGIAVVIAIVATRESPNLINTGVIPVSFFMVTIISGLTDKGALRKHLFTVRAELAIIGSILMFPHAFGYFEFYIEKFGLLNLTWSFYFGLVAYLIMIPLFLTSFQIIRKKLGYRKWKALHRLAYLFFFFVAIHLIALQNESMLSYIILFGFYFIMRGSIAVQTHYKKQHKLSKATS